MKSETILLGIILPSAFYVLTPSPPALGQCQLAKLVAVDGYEEQRFGNDVSVAPGIIVVGARNDHQQGVSVGAVYIYSFVESWNPKQKLFPSDPAIESLFGYSVACSSDHIVVGASYRDAIGERSGCAYIFSFDGEKWVESQQLIASDGDEYDMFGSDVAISGGRVLISAPRDEPGYAGSGYIFERDDSGQWVEVAKLRSNDAPIGNEMGYRVALEGTVAVLGAPLDDDEGFTAGAAYVFEPDEDGVWRQTAKLLADNGHVVDGFGSGVGISNDTILIGATNATGRTARSGAAFVFERDGVGGWQQTQRFFADDGKDWDEFGAALAVDGDLAVIGATGADDGGDHAGSGYVFSRGSDGVWSQLYELWPDDAIDHRYLGSAVALSGQTAVFGCFRDTPYGEQSGSAYVFGIGPDSDGDGEPDSCACIGDLDGDRVVGLNDFATMLTNYRHRNGSGATYEDGDLDGDGDVDLSDVSQMLFRYGAECW